MNEDVRFIQATLLVATALTIIILVLYAGITCSDVGYPYQYIML